MSPAYYLVENFRAYELNTVMVEIMKPRDKRDKRDKNLPTVLEIVDHNFLSTVFTLSTMTI